VSSLHFLFRSSVEHTLAMQSRCCGRRRGSGTLGWWCGRRADVVHKLDYFYYFFNSQIKIYCELKRRPCRRASKTTDAMPRLSAAKGRRSVRRVYEALDLHFLPLLVLFLTGLLGTGNLTQQKNKQQKNWRRSACYSSPRNATTPVSHKPATRCAVLNACFALALRLCARARCSCAPRSALLA